FDFTDIWHEASQSTWQNATFFRITFRETRVFSPPPFYPPVAAMAWVFLYVSAILLLPFVRGDLTAALGDTVKLSSQINCGERTAELIRRLSDHSSVRMAALVNGVHQPVEEYSLRLNISSSGIFLKNVNYNDNGHYEFICGDNIERIIELRVVFISNISASEGEPRKLPCFSLTQGVDVKFVQWETNGQLVIKVDLGDLSLILERVQLEDQGDYYCYVQKDSKERGDPAAWRLRVRQERPSIKTFTTPSVSIKLGAYLIFAHLYINKLFKKTGV
uniref:Ig-like domain-containing protein n=1 Tax=Poecilia mexicana TaxID=48701 RepID=A0A3B3XK68_9TELE